MHVSGVGRVGTVSEREGESGGRYLPGCGTYKHQVPGGRKEASSCSTPGTESDAGERWQGQASG